MKSGDFTDVLVPLLSYTRTVFLFLDGDDMFAMEPSNRCVACSTGAFACSPLFRLGFPALTPCEQTQGMATMGKNPPISCSY